MLRLLLNPAFQNSQKLLSNSELLTQLKPALAQVLIDENQSQIDSAEIFVTPAVKPLSLAEQEVRFKGCGPWIKDLPTLRQTQSGQMQDWITAQRKKARDRQFQLKC